MPDYNEGERLDPTQVQDVRGRKMGAPVAIGGTAGIILLIISAVLGVPLPDLGTGGGGSSLDSPAATGPSSIDQCVSGADAEQRQDCQVVLVVDSLQEYWAGAFAQRNARYRPAQTQLFSGFTQTACGGASSQVGPFYCPLDGKVYIDLDFFQELQSRLGARGGEFAQAYVVAHEYGHHVQSQIGTLQESQGGSGAQSGAVRVELQADCFAGVWAKNAIATGYFTDISESDIADGLDAAAAVGDDRIQQTTRGRVNPESFTHGTSAQRQKWFSNGFRSGQMEACDTFNNPV